ncbi:hypothetical protein [Polyangium aurulentum]|uniref:hypothetical protein n=1 Tax=Polyangium aurulentum TaxID=2567896 RepID=UPI0010AEB90E|nr:hypothetical protein [Polyangium aurulentum]UQA62896.1 hypothetical protein E8A73_021550 [Polyangium aurulentum]
MKNPQRTDGPRAFRCRAAGLLGAAVIALAPSLAQAYPPAAGDPGGRRAAAEALFDEGKTLMAEGRFAEACPKFAESQSLDAGVGTLLNLADCLEKVGRTASAWAEFRAAASAARAKGQDEREQIARARAKDLEPKLARLVVQPPSDMPQGLEIRRDGEPVGQALWGTAVPVDPGTHVVEAVAPGREPFKTVVEVPEGPGADGKGPQVTAKIPTLPDTSTGSAQRIAGLALGSAGFAGLMVASILGAQAMAINEGSMGHCQGNLCDADGVSLREKAVARGNASTGTFIAGAALLAGGAALYFTAPKPSVTTVGIRAGVGAVGSTGAGLVIGGAF